MADLVSQIFQQVPRPTNSGLGQFYAQGVAAGQRNRQLQLQEESLRLDNIAAGLKQQQFALERGAEVAQQQAETDMATVLAAIYDNELGFQNEDLVQQGMRIISRLPSSSRTGQQFLEGVKSADTIEAANRERSRLRAEMGITPSSETAQLPGGGSMTFRPRVTSEEQALMVEDATKLGATNFSVDDQGRLTGRTPTGTRTTTTVDPTTGEVRTVVEEGSAVGDRVTQRQIGTQLRALESAQQQTDALVNALNSPAAGRAFGGRGVVTDVRNQLLAQLPGGEAFFDAQAGEVKMKARTLREQLRSALTDEKGQISDKDNARIQALFPDPDAVFTSLPEARQKAKVVQEIINERANLVKQQAGQTATPASQVVPKTRAEFKRALQAGSLQFKTREEAARAYQALTE